MASRSRARRAGPPKYLAQHDFVHVLADYGTNVKGELEVFAFIGRADPDPKGFAWLATLIGLFETGYIETTGFFDRDVRERNIQAPGMHERLADAIRRGKVVCDAYGTDLFEVDYHDLADQPVAEVRAQLGVPGEVSGRTSRVDPPVRSTGKGCRRCNSASQTNGRQPDGERQLHADDRRALRRSGSAHRAVSRMGSQPGERRHHGVHGHAVCSPTATTRVTT